MEEKRKELLESKVKQIIQTKCVTGSGKTNEDPVRYIYQYWDFEGNLLAEHDTLKDSILFER